MIPAAPERGRRGGRHRTPRLRTLATAVRRAPVARSAAPALGLALLLPLSGAQAPTGPVTTGAPPAAMSAAMAAVAVAADARPVTGPAVGTDAVAPSPVRVRIPALGLVSDLERLGLGPDGALLPPADFARAGWFTGSPVPGDVGPAVIAGHVDSFEGPAVFSGIRDLAPGDEVLVDLTDGTTVRFAVVAADRYPKDRFPTDVVYGPTPRAELRLITCGGEFDADRRSYRDNVVVSAVLVS